MSKDFERIGIADIINVIKKRAKLIAIITAAFLILGAIQVFTTQDKYSSEMEFKIDTLETNGRQSDDSVVDSMLENITNSTNMGIERYENELVSDEVLEATIGDLNLEDTFTASSLRSKISLDTDPELETVKAKIVLEGSKEGLEILESMHENFTEHITNIAQENSQQLLAVIEEQMDNEKEKYTKALEEHREVTEGLKSSKELELELENTYVQITNYKTRLNDLEIEKEAVEAALEEGVSGNNGIMGNPDANGGSFYLGSGEAAFQTRRVEIDTKIQSINETIEELRESVNDIESEYQEVEFTGGLTRERLEIAKESYEAFTKKYEELNMKSSLDIGGISIKALPESIRENNPVGTRKPIKMGLFLILGIMTSLIVVFILEYIEIAKNRNKRRN